MPGSSVKPATPLTDGEHEHRRGAVDCVACRDLLGARLQEVLGLGVAFGLGARRMEKIEPTGALTCDVARPVERVEDQQVFAALVLGRDVARLLHLLGGNAGEHARPLRASG